MIRSTVSIFKCTSSGSSDVSPCATVLSVHRILFISSDGMYLLLYYPFPPPSPGGHRPAVSLILILLDMAYKLNHTVFSVWWLISLSIISSSFICVVTCVRISFFQGLEIFQCGLPWWLSGKESTDLGSIPGSERSPGEGNGNPLQYSCMGNPMDRGAWQAAVQEVAKESDTTWLLNNKTVL